MRKDDTAQAAAPDGSKYGVAIGRIIDDYPDFVIMGDADGYMARTRVKSGSAGPTLRDLTLDGLAAQMDVCRRRLDGA